MYILRHSVHARVALQRVGIFLDKPPPPKPPPKIEATYEELIKMKWTDVKEDTRDDFEPALVYNVGHSSDEESVFNYFKPKKSKNGQTGMSKTGGRTKKSIYSKQAKTTNNTKTSVEGKQPDPGKG